MQPSQAEGALEAPPKPAKPLLPARSLRTTNMPTTMAMMQVVMALALAVQPSLSSWMISIAARWTVALTRKITALMVVMALMGALRYHWNPDIKLSLSIIGLLAVTAVIGSNVGSSIAFALSGAVLRKCFGVFIILVGIRMLIK